MISLHLDTDIGDDIDDAFCLALLLSSPEIRLRSISTVLGNTPARADLCRELCNAAGVDVPIAAGARSFITRRPATNLPPELLYRAAKSQGYVDDAPGAMRALDQSRRAGDTLISIGPLTNIALATVAQKSFLGFGRYIAMAGEIFTPAFAEWNIRVDPEAAAVVCTAGISIDFIPWRIGHDTRLTDNEQARLDQAASPVARVLNDYRRQFRRHCKRQEMFDPMTVVALLQPELFQWKTGRLTVELRGEETFGQTNLHTDPSGPHRVAVEVDASRAKQWMLDRLCQ